MVTLKLTYIRFSTFHFLPKLSNLPKCGSLVKLIGKENQTFQDYYFYERLDDCQYLQNVQNYIFVVMDTWDYVLSIKICPKQTGFWRRTSSFILLLFHLIVISHIGNNILQQSPQMVPEFEYNKNLPPRSNILIPSEAVQKLNYGCNIKKPKVVKSIFTNYNSS